MANVWSKTSKELNLVSIATNIKRIKVNARWRSPRDTRSGTDLACNFSVPLQYIQIIFPFHLIFQRHVLQPSELSFYLGISYFWSAFLSCAHWLSCLYFICPIFPLGLCLSMSDLLLFNLSSITLWIWIILGSHAVDQSFNLLYIWRITFSSQNLVQKLLVSIAIGIDFFIPFPLHVEIILFFKERECWSFNH